MSLARQGNHTQRTATTPRKRTKEGGKKMKPDTNENNPTMLERMVGENETLGAAVMALFITLLMKALGLNKQAVKMTRRANGFKANEAMKVLQAGRFAAVVQDLGLNKKSTLDDYRWTLNELGAGRFSIIDNNGQPRTLRVGESAAIDKVLMTTNGQKAVKCLKALRRVKNLDTIRLDALRRSLATDVEEIEEGYAPASPEACQAFGLELGSVVRFVDTDGLRLADGNLKTKQGLHQYATRQHLRLNAGGLVNWFKASVDANSYHCGWCTKAGVRGYFPKVYPPGAVRQRNPGKGQPLTGPHPKAGKPVPVNWSAPAVLLDKLSAGVASSWNIPQQKTGTRRCPTCDRMAFQLSHNGNTAHLPLLTFDGDTCGLSTRAHAIQAVAFQMSKPTFKVVRGVLLDRFTPVDGIKALMAEPVRYRVQADGETVWQMGRLVPVWFNYMDEDGSHTDSLGLAIEPTAHAGGHGVING